MRQSKRWPVVTVPLFPYIKPDQQEPISTKRLRPLDSLDLKFLVRQVEACRITTLDLAKNPWSVISVFSPYSSDMHVMLLETGPDRYLPSPQRVPDGEGEEIIKLWLRIATYLRKRSTRNRIFIGYNWSPRSWGDEEEKTGFQSIPTKWHPMLWSWPEFPPPGQNADSVSWMATEQLNPTLRRILGVDSDHSILLDTIKEWLAPVITRTVSQCFAIKEIKRELSTVSLIIGRRLEDLLESFCFFSKLLKPLAEKLNELMITLTECFTDMDCSQIDALIERAVEDPSDKLTLDRLRKPPHVKDKDIISSSLQEHGLPVDLFDVLYKPIRSRCLQEGEAHCWWRKGFGYALVIGDGIDDQSCSHIKIMPGTYVGPGGVVEAQGVVLQRPENRSMSIKRIRTKSAELHALQKYLENL